MFYVDGVCQLDIVDLSMVDEGPPCGDVRWRRRGRNGWLSLSLNLFFPFWKRQEKALIAIGGLGVTLPMGTLSQ